MYAETKAEKRKYARKFSKLFYQYTDRVLGFQKLIRQANKDFYGNPSMFDYVPVQKKQSEPKRVSRAIELKDCNQLCVDEVKRLIKLAIIFPVDFYFSNSVLKLFIDIFGLLFQNPFSLEDVCNWNDID
jgi:hypothetical protein